MTGTSIFSKKLKNKYNASPVYCQGLIFFTSVKGETLVLKAGREPKILAENKLSGEFYATPAISQNSFIFRNDRSLYRIGVN
jgi:hypothetical protein